MHGVGEREVLTCISQMSSFSMGREDRANISGFFGVFFFFGDAGVIFINARIEGTLNMLSAAKLSNSTLTLREQ